MAGAPLPPMEKRKEVLLERWHSHTAQCKTCQRVGPSDRAQNLRCAPFHEPKAFGVERMDPLAKLVAMWIGCLELGLHSSMRTAVHCAGIQDCQSCPICGSCSGGGLGIWLGSGTRPGHCTCVEGFRMPGGRQASSLTVNEQCRDIHCLLLSFTSCASEITPLLGCTSVKHPSNAARVQVGPHATGLKALCAAGMAACGGAWSALQRLAQRFIYVEWNHALND